MCGCLLSSSFRGDPCAFCEQGREIEKNFFILFNDSIIILDCRMDSIVQSIVKTDGKSRYFPSFSYFCKIKKYFIFYIYKKIFLMYYEFVDEWEALIYEDRFGGIRQNGF